MTNINWNSPETQQIITEYSQLLNISVEYATSRLKRATLRYQKDQL